MNEQLLIARSAFAGLASTHGACNGDGDDTNHGVVATDRDGLELATVIARKNCAALLAARLRERFAIDLPFGPTRTASENIAFAGTAPGAWLATRPGSDGCFAAQLRAACGELASIVEQSDGYAVLRLSGPKVREALAKLLPIDLHPRVFKENAVAATVAHHINVTLWRSEDSPEGWAVFDIAVFRSLAGSFRQALEHSAAELGLTLVSSNEG